MQRTPLKPALTFVTGLCILVCPVISSGADEAQRVREFYEPGIELPAGEGRELIVRACTRCHTLEGVPAYRKYWGYERWLPMVENMIEHGAELNEAEKIIVTRYLARYYGTD
jgi:hypothetical protein